MYSHRRSFFMSLSFCKITLRFPHAPSDERWSTPRRDIPTGRGSKKINRAVSSLRISLDRLIDLQKACCFVSASALSDENLQRGCSVNGKGVINYFRGVFGNLEGHERVAVSYKVERRPTHFRLCCSLVAPCALFKRRCAHSTKTNCFISDPCIFSSNHLRFVFSFYPCNVLIRK